MQPDCCLYHDPPPDPGAARALAPAPIPATIAQLGSLPRTARRRAYVIEGVVAAVKTEADQDKHVIVQDGAASMILEFPDPGCAQGSLALAAIVRARRQIASVRVGQRIQAACMLFFDRPHGQSGSAPNSVEGPPCFWVKVLP